MITVFEDPEAPKPSYLMWLEWTDGRISFIRDYRYVRYGVDDAELVLAPDEAPTGDAARRAWPPTTDDRNWRVLLGAASLDVRPY